MKKIYFSILALLLITSFSDLKSGVLRQYDYTKYNYLFPDSLHKRFRIRSLDTDFTHIMVYQSTDYFKDSTGKIKFKTYAIHKNIFPGKPASNTIDVYDGDSLINVNFDSLEIKKYKNGWYNIKNSFINFSKNLHIKVPMTFIDTLDVFLSGNDWVDSVINFAIDKIYISSNDEFFCIGYNEIQKTIYKVIAKLVDGKWKLITEPWEKEFKYKKRFLQIRHYLFTDNDELFYTRNGAINILNLNTLDDKELAIFDSFKDTGDDFYVHFDYKAGDTYMYFNHIKNELIFAYRGYRLVLIYNILQNSHKYVQQDFDNLKDYRLGSDNAKVFIDSKGIEYFINESDPRNFIDPFHLMLIRDLDNKITPVELPKELNLSNDRKAMNCYMSNDNKIYFFSKYINDKDTVKPYYVYVYDHYSSGVEDDYHNKSLVFEPPFPNPVGIESKVSGKFFAMPYLISGLTMDLYNINGSKVLDLSGSVNYDPSTGHGNYSFSTHGLPSGMYYLIFNSSVYKDCKNIIVK